MNVRNALSRFSRRRELATVGGANASVKPAILPGYLPYDVGGIFSRNKKKFMAGLFVLLFFYIALFSLFPRALSLPFLIPVGLLYLTIIWVLPVSNYRPTPILAGCFWAYFISLLMWPTYLAIAIPGLPWITMGRLFGGPMVLLLLILASSCLPFRTHLKAALGNERGITMLVTGFAIAMMISLGFTDNPFSTLNRTLNNQIIWTAMFFASVWVFRDPRKIHVWMTGYVMMVAILCVIAFFEARKGGVLWAEIIPSFLQIEDESVQRTLNGIERFTGGYRVVGTATTPLSFAELLGLSSAFILYTIYTGKLWMKVAAIALDLAVMHTISLTDSRLGFVSFILCHVGFLLFYSYSIRKRQPNSLWGMSLLMSYPAFLVFVVAAVLFVGRVRNSVLGNGRTSASDGARGEQWSLAFQKMWGSPIFGFGAGQSGSSLGFTNQAGVVTVDSYYITILMDYGLIGVFLFYGMFLRSIWRGGQLALRGSEIENIRAAALTVFLGAFLVTKSVLSQEATHPMIFMAVGAVVALSYQARRRI